MTGCGVISHAAVRIRAGMCLSIPAAIRFLPKSNRFADEDLVRLIDRRRLYLVLDASVGRTLGGLTRAN